MTGRIRLRWGGLFAAVATAAAIATLAVLARISLDVLD